MYVGDVPSPLCRTEQTDLWEGMEMRGKKRGPLGLNGKMSVVPASRLALPTAPML